MARRGVSTGALPKPSGREPSAMRAGDGAGEIRNGSDHRRSGLSRRTAVPAIVAARMKPQCARIMNSLEAAIVQISLDERPADRLRHGDQPLRSLW